MRIALVFEFPSLNGGERSMLAVVRQLRGRGIEFIALAPGNGPLKESLASCGIRTLPFNVRDPDGNRRPREDILKELGETLTAADCDLVHANSLSMGRLTGAIAGELPVPAVAHLRDILKLSQTAVRELNANTHLVAVSEATRSYHIAQGLAGERVLTIYNGVDTNEFQPRRTDGEVRRELGLAADDFLVLTVGQIGLRKGQDILAEAAALLAPRLPSACYVLAGERSSNKEESLRFEEQITARLGRLAGGDRLRLLGNRGDMPRLMNACDVLVHPANQEPLGRVLLEASASGRPIIATDVGGTREILQHGESALLVPAGSPQALADAMMKLADDPKLRSKLAENARRRIVEHFPIETAAAKLEALWNNVARDHSTRPR